MAVFKYPPPTPEFLLILCHNTQRRKHPKGYPFLYNTPMYLFFIGFVIRVRLWSCPRINTHSHNVLVYSLDELFLVRTVMWSQIRSLYWTKKILHSLIRSIQKGFDACSNYVLFSTDLYHILALGFLLLGAQPCPYLNPSNY